MPPRIVSFMPAFRHFLRISVPLCCLFYAASVYAAGITVEDVNADPNMVGGVTLRAVGTEMGTWESNPLMLTNGAKALYGSITTPELIFNDNTPTTHLHEDLSAPQNIFNQSTFDSSDIHSKFGIDKDVQNWTAGLQQTVDYDTTRTSELSNFNLRTKPLRHTGLGYTPQVAFKPNGTDKYSLQGNYSTSDYDGSAFTNYENYTVTPSYTHNFDELNAGIFSLQAHRYKSTSGPRNTEDTVGPSIGWLGTLTPNMTANANVGLQEQRQFSDTVSKHWSLDYTFSGGLNYKGIQDLTNFTLSRNQYPFGDGTEALLTTFGVTENHAINERLWIIVGASYQTANYQTSGAGNLDTLASGNGGLNYHVTDHFDLTGTYQYRHETYTGVSTSAEDHSFLLGVVYHPETWSF